MQPPPTVPVSAMEAEIKRLREQVAELEGTSDTGASSRAPKNFWGGRRWVHPSDARFDPGGAQPVDRRSADRSAGSARRWEHGTSTRIDVEDGGRGRTTEVDHLQPDGLMRLVSRAIAHQCGLLGCRVGEGSNPGLVQTRQARRLERLRSTQVETQDDERGIWSEETDFGQSRFGHPDLTNFGQSNFGQSIFGQYFGVMVGPQRVGGQTQKQCGAPKGGAPKGGGPKGGGPKFRAFFPSPAVFYSFFPLFWSFSLNFGGVFEDRDPEMCTSGVFGLSCASRQGFHTTAREPKRAHFRVPVFKNTTKIPREIPQRGRKE